MWCVCVSKKRKEMSATTATVLGPEKANQLPNPLPWAAVKGPKSSARHRANYVMNPCYYYSYLLRQRRSILKSQMCFVTSQVPKQSDLYRISSDQVMPDTMAATATAGGGGGGSNSSSGSNDPEYLKQVHTIFA